MSSLLVLHCYELYDYYHLSDALYLEELSLANRSSLSYKLVK